MLGVGASGGRTGTLSASAAASIKHPSVTTRTNFGATPDPGAE